MHCTLYYAPIGSDFHDPVRVCLMHMFAELFSIPFNRSVQQQEDLIQVEVYTTVQESRLQDLKTRIKVPFEADNAEHMVST